ncbi:hypothetical protein PILCRDRAFT_4958 [Piloderma croceum F 1598]|uniref:Uncharacterized protein n=1 Tax=Piloderma croceum (strain F 1598) TaxID=765440 RepID=A0A0C3BJF7_PILCF|nr:hypothetical protein PILCRDRAFT_4958 [Piloderma croceum F 1598]
MLSSSGHLSVGKEMLVTAGNAFLLHPWQQQSSWLSKARQYLPLTENSEQQAITEGGLEYTQGPDAEDDEDVSV